jgi:mRNA-degrading endonuclease YafQ of YafQ-DinJ toxin-antitoxin module
MDFKEQKRKTPSDFFNSLKNYDNFVFNVYKTNTFKKNVTLCYKRNFDLELLEQIVVKLARKEELSENNLPHLLKGYKKKQNEEVMECHI